MKTIKRHIFVLIVLLAFLVFFNTWHTRHYFLVIGQQIGMVYRPLMFR